MEHLKHLSRRGLALLLVLVMCVGMLGTTAFAEDGDGSEAENLVAAIESGATSYTLSEDAEIDGALEIANRDFTLDLDGHTLTIGCLKSVNGNLTIKNGKIVRGSIAPNSNGDPEAMVTVLNFINGSVKTVRFEDVNFYSERIEQLNNLTIDIEGILGRYDVVMDNCTIYNCFSFYCVDATLKDCDYSTDGYQKKLPVINASESNIVIDGGSYIGCGNELLSDKFVVGNTEPPDSGELRNDTAVVLSGTFTNVENVAKWVDPESAFDAGTGVVTAPVYVAEVNGVGYTTLQAAITAANSGDEVKLLKDVEVLKGKTGNDNVAALEIEKSLTLDGQGHTLTVDGRGVYTYGGATEADMVDVTFKNITIVNHTAAGRAINARGDYQSLTLDNATLRTTTTNSDNQVLTIGGSHDEQTKVEIKDSSIIAGGWGYGIITFNPVDMTISNSQVSAFCALDMKYPSFSTGSRGSVVNIIDGSEMIGQGWTDQELSTIIFRDADIEVNIVDSTIKAFGAEDGPKPTLQTAICFSDWMEGDDTYNTEPLTAGTITVNISGGSVVEWENVTAGFVSNTIKGKDNFTAVVSISGGTFTGDVTEYCVESKCAQPKDGAYVVADHAWTEGESTATCTEAGERTDICACGATKTEQVSATGHTPGDPVEVAARVGVEGSITVSCTVCGTVISTETIPALPAPVIPVVTRPAEPEPEDPVEIEDEDPPLADLPFIDVSPDAWYAQPIASVYSMGLMNGMSDMIFSPKTTLNRGMMAQIIHNMAKNPEATVVSAFTDLNGRYYTEAVAWGVEHGVLKGYSDGLYGGEDTLTREQMATMLYRYAVNQELGGDVDVSVLDSFADSGRISGYAREAMAWAVENGLLKGRGNNDLDPRADITRAEVAAVLDRYAKLFLA